MRFIALFESIAIVSVDKIAIGKGTIENWKLKIENWKLKIENGEPWINWKLNVENGGIFIH